MKNLLKCNLLTLVICTTWQSKTFAMPDPADEEIDSSLSNKVALVRQAFDSTIQYTNRIKKLANAEKWGEIIDLNQQMGFEIPLEILKKGTLIQNYFDYTYAISQAYQAKAKQLETAEAVQLYRQSIEYCLTYIDVAYRWIYK